MKSIIMEQIIQLQEIVGHLYLIITYLKIILIKLQPTDLCQNGILHIIMTHLIYCLFQRRGPRHIQVVTD